MYKTLPHASMTTNASSSTSIPVASSSTSTLIIKIEYPTNPSLEFIKNFIIFMEDNLIKNQSLDGLLTILNKSIKLEILMDAQASVHPSSVTGPSRLYSEKDKLVLDISSKFRSSVNYILRLIGWTRYCNKLIKALFDRIKLKFKVDLSNILDYIKDTFKPILQEEYIQYMRLFHEFKSDIEDSNLEIQNQYKEFTTHCIEEYAKLIV